MTDLLDTRTVGPAVLDPLAPAKTGVWSAAGVRVIRRTWPHRPHADEHSRCTTRFCARRQGELLTIQHDLRPDELCDGLALLISEELDGTGVLNGQAEFEAVFTGIVRSTVDGPLAAWARFYGNSLDRLERGAAAFAPIHEHAQTQIRGASVVDLGSCFGFFPLRLADAGYQVTATDLSAPTMRLLRRIGNMLGREVHTLAADATDVPLPEDCADTVTALHLIEHLDPATTRAVLREALRLARRRVVVAVPFEDEPRACYGHVQRFDHTALVDLGAELCSGDPILVAAVHEYHGGWLILERH